MIIRIQAVAGRLLKISVFVDNDIEAVNVDRDSNHVIIKI
jgi:hypothetical protein